MDKLKVFRHTYVTEHQDAVNTWVEKNWTKMRILNVAHFVEGEYLITFIDYEEM